MEQPVSNTDVVRVLTTARAKVQRRWIQGSATDSMGGVCTQSALDYAATEHRVYPQTAYKEAERLVRAVIKEQYTTRYWTSIPEWNDSPVRTKTQVLAVFDEAIRRANEVEEKAPTPKVESVEVESFKVEDLVIPPLPETVYVPSTWSKIKEALHVGV